MPLLNVSENVVYQIIRCFFISENEHVDFREPNTEGADREMATKHWLSICIVLAIPLFQVEARATKNESKGPLFEKKRNEEVRPTPLLARGADLIAISPCTSNIVFEASCFQPEETLVHARG